MTEEVIRGERALATLANNRSKTAIQHWIKDGCPHSLDGKTHVFIESDVVGWCNDRGIDFYDKEKKEPSLLQQQKLRQETYKANELQRKERINEGEWASVQEFEETQVIILQQIKRLMIEVVGEIKKETGLKGSAAEQVDAKLITGFNRIADIDLGE